MNNKILITPTKIIKYNLLDLTGESIHKEDKESKITKYEFGTYKKGIIESSEIYKIYDPSNDQVFKILFNGKYSINKCSGLERAKSLIESLLYKFPNKNSIKTIGYWQNEIPNLKGKNRKGLKILDFPLICEMIDGKKYLIDLEMQNYFYEGINLNALTYATALRNASHIPVIIILLLYKESELNNSFIINPSKKYYNESKYKKINDYVEVICFDLYYILECIRINEKPDLNGFEISKVGKEWVKLLTIKDWMNKCYDEKKKYPIPKELEEPEEIKSALIILNSLNNAQLIKTILNEKEEKILIENTEKRTLIQIYIEGFLKQRDVDGEIVPFPEVAPEFLINICKKKLNKLECISFLKILITKKIINAKNIHEELINSSYD